MTEWQPIETAPTDGREVLLFARGLHGPRDVSFAVGQWSLQSEDWFWAFAIRPTHWMPLPEPPANE
jgi:uncharacterized protein DUF551